MKNPNAIIEKCAKALFPPEKSNRTLKIQCIRGGNRPFHPTNVLAG